MQNSEKKCEIGGIERCKDCEIFSKHRNEIFQKADSIFDAVSDLHGFIEKCSKHCTKTVDNRLKK